MDLIPHLLKKVTEAEDAARNANRNLINAQQALREALSSQLKLRTFDIAFGSWDCETSPTKLCIYNRRKDPALDDCLFCHDPAERK